MLGLGLILSACGPSQAELAVEGTRTVANLLATLNVEPPPQANTLAPSITPSPTTGFPITPATTPTIRPSPAIGHEPGRHYDEEGSFSIIPPSDWEFVEIPGLSFHVLYGPIISGFRVNINFLEEYFEGSLDGYFQAARTFMEISIDGLEIIEVGEFLTDMGHPGIRMLAENFERDPPLRTIQYFFDGPWNKSIITCSMPAVVGDELDALCDESVQSFRLE